MPCNTIVLNRVELGRVNPSLLGEAVKKVAESVESISATDTFRFRAYGRTFEIRDRVLLAPRGYEYVADELKRACSDIIIRQAARRFGWTLKQGPTPQRMTLTRA